MPLFDDDASSSFTTDVSGFAFSGATITDLGASEYTLVGIVADRSGSVSGFASEIEGCLKSALEGCQKSPRVDNLLVRLLAFNHGLQEEHGFRPLADCHLANYDGFLKPSGATALYDASVNAVDALATYGKELQDQRFTANGLLVILTDGEESGASTLGVKQVKEAMARARQSEALESLTTILIGINVNNPMVHTALEAFKTDAGFDQYVEAQDASPKTFARIAGFISRSVSSVSQAVGTGAKSSAITF